MLASLKSHFPRVPMAAYTATATPEVREDITSQLGLNRPVVLVGNFHRPNLTYHVQRRNDGYNQICSVMDRIIQQSTPEQCERAQCCLKSVEQYCHGLTCRHKFLVEYFGQTFAQPCQACDVCLGKLAAVEEPLRKAQMILSCALRCKENFGATHIAKVLVGSKETKILQFGHDRLSAWGLMKEYSSRQVRDWIEQLLSQDFLQRVGEYNVLKVTAAGWEVLRGQTIPTLAQTVKANVGTTSMKVFDSWEGVDRELFEQLRVLRRQLAVQSGVAAFIVFSDATLRDLARRRPTRRELLLSVHGIGERKADDYGESVMQLIRQWCDERHIESNLLIPKAANVPTSPTASKNANNNAMAAFVLFDEGLTVEQIAERLGRAKSTVIDYLEAYIRHHQITDPSPWVEASLAKKIRIAAAYNDTGRLRPLFEAFHGKVSYETLRVVLACDSTFEPQSHAR